MKSIPLSELASKWPEAEAALATQPAVVITRNSKPLAKLVPLDRAKKHSGKQFSAAAHMKKLRARHSPIVARALLAELERERSKE